MRYWSGAERISTVFNETVNCFVCHSGVRVLVDLCHPFFGPYFAGHSLLCLLNPVQRLSSLHFANKICKHIQTKFLLNPSKCLLLFQVISLSSVSKLSSFQLEYGGRKSGKINSTSGQQAVKDELNKMFSWQCSYYPKKGMYSSLLYSLIYLFFF